MRKTKSIKFILIVLVLTLIVGVVPAFAMESSHNRWPVTSTGSSDNSYLTRNGFVHFKGIEEGFRYSLPTYFCVEISLKSALQSYYLEPDYYNSVNNIGGVYYDSGIRIEDDTRHNTQNHRVEPAAAGPADYSQMQFWRFYDANSDKSVVFPVLMFTENPVDDEKTINKLEAYTQRAEKLLSLMQSFDALYDDLEASQNATAVKLGGHHPYDINLLCKIANSIQTIFGFTVGYFDTHDYWIEGNGWAGASAEDIVRHWTEYIPYGSDRPIITSDDLMSRNELNMLDRLLDTIGPYWVSYIENHRIEKPEITYYEVAGSRGLIDPMSKTITIRMPADTDWNNLPKPIIETTGEALCTVSAGSLKSGQVLYQVTPGDRATGTFYNGHDSTGFGFGVDLSENWKVVVEEGTPFTKALSFVVKTEDGKARNAKIIEGENGSKGSVILNLPFGTDLSLIRPEIDYAGEGYYFKVNGTKVEDGLPIDWSKTVELVVYNTAYDVENVYEVHLTANKSSENRILSYKIDGAEGVINDDSINVAIPFATDLSVTEAEIELSEFAELTSKPDVLGIGDNEYIVTAEDGTTKTYTVSISRAAASKEKNILSFKCGGYSAVINNSKSTITLELPKGLPYLFAPEITASEFATISPASGEVQDFSSPVKYKVMAQNGSSKTYTVTVSIQEETAPNPYQASLEDILEKIITRYRSEASDDWEWMDLGFYERISENYNEGKNHDFNLASELSTLDSTKAVGMTEIARTVMMLTARGFDCSNLAKYNGGTPFKDSQGNDVDDLVNNLYNFSGSYTINGPIFALIALDMGDYTIPEDARWTREKLLDELAVYSGDEFGIDMVGAIMYAIAPYQDDPVYGSLVRDKLNSCLAKIISKMNSDYSFGAWGATNSESAAWIMMGLCSMGIDWNVDPRFSDGQGHSALQHWMDNFANVQEGYFHHTTSVKNNYMATYEGCYASMWYLAFLDHGGQGHPYYFYYHRFDFSKTLSDDASILSFEIEGKQGVITEGEENTIVVTLANGTPLENLTPVITLAEGAKQIEPKLPVTFIEGTEQPFTICAEDGKTFKTYHVTIVYEDVQASGAELDVDSITLENSEQNEETILKKTVTQAEDGATEILISVNPGVDTSRMYLDADISYAASCSPVLDAGTAYDFSDWLTVTITSEDGLTTNVYRIKVVAKAKAEITAFRVQAGETWYSGDIDNTANTIVVRDVDDSILTSTELVTDIDFTGRTCQPTSGLAMDFAGAVTYTLGGDAELASRSYTVSVLNLSGKYISAQSSGEDPSGGSSISQQLWDAVMEESDVVDHQTSYVGWINLNGAWYYAQGSGAFATGWLKDGSTWYYLNPETCAMMTGWVQVNNTWYYLKESGAMATGWVKDGDTWYYMNSSGAMQTGWVKVHNTWYYMKSSGAMAANEWVTGYYWVGASGAWTYQAKGSWKQNSTGWWFGDTSGWYAKNETITISGKSYSFNAAGYWVQ